MQSVKIVHSNHWMLKRRKRPDISDDLIDYAISHSPQYKDKHWNDALNAITQLPHNGRTLKVVYRREHDTMKIITAYWLT